MAFFSEHRRVPKWSPAVLLMMAPLVACSSGDIGYGSNDSGYRPQPTPVAVRTEPAAAVRVVPQPDGLGASVVSVTGADGYPNINVDTAGRSKVPPRTAAERDRLEAELLALGERQHAGVDTSKPNSVIQELQELGRRSRAETEQLIQSGAVPETP
jgi:hypothetical protein